MDKYRIEKDIYSTFANVASTMGYSEIHGRIIAALLVSDGELSLDKLSKKIGYSGSSVSISLDLLELLGMIKKIKKPGDRKLYVKLEGSLLSGLKKAFLIRIRKSVDDTLGKFEEYKKELKKSKEKTLLKTIKKLENEIKKLERYLNLVSRLK